MTKQVVVIGAAGIDIKGTPDQHLLKADSNPGTIRRGMGGVARNMAENLAKLAIKTTLITVIGNDVEGQRLIAHSLAHDIQLAEGYLIDNATTGTYLAILDEQGDLALALSDYAIMQHLTPQRLQDHSALLQTADMIVIDLNLKAETLRFITTFAQNHDKKLAVNPTSVRKAPKLSLQKGYLLVCNHAESTVLAPLHDVFEHVVITEGARGVRYRSYGEPLYHAPAQPTTLKDATGAGDALMAGIIAGLLHDAPLAEAVQHGQSIAHETLMTYDTVYRKTT